MTEFDYIFHIGRGKSGTTSLCTALNILGIPCTHHYKDISKEVYEDWGEKLSKNVKPNFDICKYKAFTDISVFTRHFKTLDLLFDKAKFILTIRELESWLDSKDRHQFLKTGQHIDRNKLSNNYKKLISDILYYFQNKQDKLLVMNIVGGDGYDKLCPFLKISTPCQPFPHENIKNSNLLE